ncbi:MAG: PEP-CTERM sorting domain-containing protein, partial [Akkermansiaceae bacterium]|nr:PEP-CTERM sorting domain-containing protein [Akkermansiaceae bacterium]
VDASAAPEVPAVPEPGVATLLLSAGLLALWHRRRRKD